MWSWKARRKRGRETERTHGQSGGTQAEQDGRPLSEHRTGCYSIDRDILVLLLVFLEI